MISKGLGKMFEGDSSDMRGGGRAEGLLCADLGARTLIGASGNFTDLLGVETQGTLKKSRETCV
jgi:hypothetical protein